MAPPRTALIAVTSAHTPLYPEGKETGLFITEALHPFEVFRKAGFEVDLVSETGSYQADWLSRQKEWLKDDERNVWEDHSGEFRTGDVKWEEYGIFFASAGHVSLIDYPDAKGLQEIAASMYGKGGIISAECHGGDIFPGITTSLPASQSSLAKKSQASPPKVKPRKGFWILSNRGIGPTIEAAAGSAGAKYIPPPTPWAAFAHTDGRIVTGANPASAQVTAEAAVQTFAEL